MSKGARLALALCLAAGTIGLAACDDGQQSNTDYVESVNSVAESFGEGVTELTSKVSKIDSLPAAADALASFQERADDLAARLDDVSPPDEVAELNDRLVDLLESLADKAGTAAAALKAGDIIGLATLSKVASEAAEVSEKIDSTVDEIRAKLPQ